MKENMLQSLRGKTPVDWKLFIPAFLLSLAGLVTMDSFSGDHYFFIRQASWIVIAIAVFFIANVVDWRFLRRTKVVVTIFLIVLGMLALLFVVGHVAKGAQSWFRLGLLGFQPSDLAKLATIFMLAKYFSRRHIEIANIKHIIVSGVYALLVFVLVFLQPDFGGAVIIFLLWLGMVFVSGLSKKHFLIVVSMGVAVTMVLWLFVFQPYQKARIVSFINPLGDIQGSGYNAYQSTIAVGSGQILGKGIGYGTQSKLQFLPEYETDFIFAAFAEEWGFIGTVILLILCLALIMRIISKAQNAPTNFETLYGLGLAILFSIHIGIHAGMNIGSLPVTGITFPFMSYGGSHLVTEWFALGVLSSMGRFSKGPRLS